MAGLLHGNPVEFVQQSVLHTVLALGAPGPASVLAIEFQPGDGSPALLLGLAALLLWRSVRGTWTRQAVSGPVFALAALGWLLGFLVIRFWSDWGGPALLAWMAVELEDALEAHVPEHSTRRLSLAAERALAGPGGILYTDDMRLFFELFFARPRAPWRYAVGYEPGLTPRWIMLP